MSDSPDPADFVNEPDYRVNYIGTVPVSELTPTQERESNAP